MFGEHECQKGILVNLSHLCVFKVVCYVTYNNLLLKQVFNMYLHYKLSTTFMDHLPSTAVNYSFNAFLSNRSFVQRHTDVLL